MEHPTFHDPLPLGPDATPYRLVPGSDCFVSEAHFDNQALLRIDPRGLQELARLAMREVAFFLRPGHNRQLAAILEDPEASDNDQAVALALLRNGEIASNGVLPLCQDTGTAIVIGHKGQFVWTGTHDAAWISAGIRETYTREYLRYSQLAPLDMYREINTGDNLPAQIDIFADPGRDYRFLFIAKGGGSANKTLFFQETKALLNPDTLLPWLRDKMLLLGTAACPPYHLAFVIGGTSAEANLKTVKLATTGYLDNLPASGNRHGRAFRDHGLEARLQQVAWELGIGAQFGGKYFVHDVRVIRLPRHGASCPVGMGVSCSADRNIKARIDAQGLWLEELDTDPGRLIPSRWQDHRDTSAVPINLNQPMDAILAALDPYPVATRLLLSGTIIVGRDIAHARWKTLLDKGRPLPAYLLEHPVYYAGPAKKPPGKPSGSFGPTTAGRMDSYVDLLQSRGGSLVMIAKGNRSNQVTRSCQRHGGFYLGAMGGPAALIAEKHIRRVRCLDYEDLGMEAVWEIEVQDLPVFILVDNKGNDFFARYLS